MTQETTEHKAAHTHEEEPPHPLEEGLDVYPLRDPSEDPRWALRIVWTWVGIMIFLLLFIFWLLIAGIWHD